MEQTRQKRRRAARNEAGRMRRRRQQQRQARRVRPRRRERERADTEKLYHRGAVSIVERAFGSLLHSKQTLCLVMAVSGVLFASRLAVATVGRAMARFFGGSQKHGIKQVDRLLSNEKLSLATLFEGYVPVLLGTRGRALVTCDWTEFDADDHCTLVVSLVAAETRRAIPLIWRTVYKSKLKGHQRRHEREVLSTLRRLVPERVHIFVLSDRGFGDVALYRHMSKLRMSFVTRFRPNIGVAYQGRVVDAGELVPSNGRVRAIKNTTVTRAERGPYNVVLVKTAGMKEPWCLASNMDIDGHEMVSLYGCRFQCEEAFRDAKDRRFGLGLRDTRITIPARRDRLLMLFCLAYLVHTAAGATSEATGVDAMIRANTEKRRGTHSLFRQGIELLGHISRQVYESIKDEFRARIRVLLTKGADVALATGRS